MKRVMICVIIILSCIIFIPLSYSKDIDVNRNLGIGLQGNYPLVGGISVRYYGLSPLLIQVVGRAILNGEERDNTIGGGISYIIFKHVGSSITRLYFSLESGERYEKEIAIGDWEWDDVTKQTIYIKPNREFDVKKTHGFAVAFGCELTVPIFGTQIGLNAEIGQGLGRINENSKKRDMGKLIFGSGLHIYF